MNFLSKLLNKKQQPKTSSVDDTHIDIIISLNKNFEVDLSLFIDCDYRKQHIDLVDYILLCSKFLNFDTNKLRKQIVDILDNQIKNQDNALFINGLISVLINEQILNNDTNTLDNIYIKPSQVFTKHIHEHQ